MGTAFHAGDSYQVARRLRAGPVSARLPRPFTDKQEEERRLHTAHVHQPERPVVVDPAEMVDDRLSVIDHCRVQPAAEFDLSQHGGGAVGA